MSDASGSTVLGFVVTCAVAAALVLSVTATVGAVALARGRAQDAADAAALAAAHAPAAPVAAARRAAETMGGSVTDCSCGGATVTVEVAVPVATPGAAAIGLRSVRASASARLVPLADPRL